MTDRQIFNLNSEEKECNMSSTATQTQTLPTRVVGVSDAPAEDSFPSIVPAEQDAKFQSLVRGNRTGTLKLRGIPIHNDPYAKRKWMKEHMAAAFRFFGKQGYGEGISGHISIRGAPFLYWRRT
jgi:hypothetical protein